MRPALARLPVWLLVLLLAPVLHGCGDDSDDAVARDRAEQARQAALEAGLGTEVAAFLALLATGETATYEVTYPGRGEDPTVVVTNRPPDRRVDLLADGEITETRLVVDGQAFECRPEGGTTRCERTDAFEPPPGVFTERAVTELHRALTARADDFTFDLETVPVAGVEARCLRTERRRGRDRPELGDAGTLCVAPSGALLLVDRDGERLEASDYTAEVDDDRFDLPDRADG